MDDNFVSMGLNEETKIGENVTLYHRKLLKKRPGLCTFCVQSVIQGLTASQ
jgi:hypothetical protein